MVSQSLKAKCHRECALQQSPNNMDQQNLRINKWSATADVGPDD
jgi:hypothetical protein